jgi:hypothetical protein
LDTTLVYNQAARLDMEGCGMNLQEIVEQVGGVFDVLALGRHDGVLFTRTELERFVELVAAHEREECIRECYEVAEFQGDAHDCAAAIRARSKA